MNLHRYEKSHTLSVIDAPVNRWTPGMALLLSNGVGGMSPLRDENGKVVVFGPSVAESLAGNAQTYRAAAEKHKAEMASVIRALGFDPAKWGIR